MLTRSRTLTTLAVLLGCSLAPAWAQEDHAHHRRSTADYIERLEDPGRDAWQQPERVVEALGLRAGQVVAEIGSGSGYFTLRLARAVGPEGKVYAVDIDPALREHLAGRLAAEGLTNVEIVEADPDDPKLPPESVDLVFVCNTLHHIAQRELYYPKLADALRPGGRLANVDFVKKELPYGPPPGMKIVKSACREEIEAAGFRLREDLGFLEYQYFLLFDGQ